MHTCDIAALQPHFFAGYHDSASFTGKSVENHGKKTGLHLILSLPSFCAGSRKEDGNWFLIYGKHGLASCRQVHPNSGHIWSLL